MMLWRIPPRLRVIVFILVVLALAPAPWGVAQSPTPQPTVPKDCGTPFDAKVSVDSRIDAIVKCQTATS